MKASLLPRTLAAAALLLATSASACPFCESETGRQVRAGIFDAEFLQNLLLTLLPFPVFLGIVALIHFGLPWRRVASRRGTRSAHDAGDRP